MSSGVRESVKDYYGSRLETSADLQTNATTCTLTSMNKSACNALKLVHPDVAKRFFGCGVVIPEKLEGCKVLDLGSGSGRDCYIISKLVGEHGQVTGVDMIESMISASQKFIQYHQEKFGYEKPNIAFVQGYLEKLDEAGIQSNSLDVLVSNCVLCLCPDKRAVLAEAFRVLKEGGELYFSDLYASEVVPESFKEDPVLWGEGMGGSLFWQDFISLAKEVGFSTPYLVAGSEIVVHNAELVKKAGSVKYASGTYRLFKLPQTILDKKALVTYKGTVADNPEEMCFDAAHSFKTNVAMEVDGEMATVLQSSRFSSDFNIQMLDTHHQAPSKYCHLSPFLLACKLGASMKQCSKREAARRADDAASGACEGSGSTGGCGQ
ncbi:arsenite methyltransferase [Engraulis encrasicolus]|uniref:arsenite methyltransferase n=1 Tax=Engraulis encrasicolus TaxID=184585 RepID=UPI002FCE995C